MVGAAQIPLIGLVFGPDYIPSIYIIFKLSQALNTAFGMYSSANYPIFTRLVAEDNWVDARSVVKKTLKLGLIIHVISGIGIILASNQLALTFFHIEFNINKVMVVLLAINHIVTSVASLPAGFVVAFGRNPFALSTLAHGALFFLMIIILSNWIGVLALPIAGLLSVLLTNAWFNFLHMHRMWADINYNIVK